MKKENKKYLYFRFFAIVFFFFRKKYSETFSSIIYKYPNRICVYKLLPFIN